MNFGRYKQTDWLECYRRCRIHLRCALSTDKPNAKQLEYGSWLLLEAHYGGPWKMLYALFKREVGLFVEHYAIRHWRKLKRRFRFKPNDEPVVVAERYQAEALAVEELARQL